MGMENFTRFAELFRKQYGREPTEDDVQNVWHETRRKLLIAYKEMPTDEKNVMKKIMVRSGWKNFPDTIGMADVPLS